jgi:hypothetical protein
MNNGPASVGGLACCILPAGPGWRAGFANSAGTSTQSPQHRNLLHSITLPCSKEQQMTDNKNPNEKQPGEKSEGKYHYNPGNQSGKTAENVPNKEAKKDEPPRDRS